MLLICHNPLHTEIVPVNHPDRLLFTDTNLDKVCGDWRGNKGRQSFSWSLGNIWDTLGVWRGTELSVIHATLAGKFCSWYHICSHVETAPGGEINGVHGPERDWLSSINGERKGGALHTEQEPNSLPAPDLQSQGVLWWGCVTLCSLEFLQVLPL